MRRSKAEVDCYVSSVQSASPAEKPTKGFLFAKLYFEAKEYELAKRHVSAYLTVRERDPKAHRFLGQLYEREGDVNKAVGCYRRSVDLNPAQKDLVLKVAELLCSKPEPDGRAEFWVEKAAKLLPGSPAVYNLKEKLLSAQGQKGWNQLFDLLQSELQLRPGNVHVNVKLVQLYCSDGRLEEAVKHCRAVERRGDLRQSLDWYCTVVDTLQEYVAQPSVSSSEAMARQLHRELLLALCNRLRLTLSDRGVQQSVEALQSFDHAMQTVKKLISSTVDELCEVFAELRGHLYMHAGTLLLKMANEKQQTWREVIYLAGLCYLLAYQVPRPKNRPTKGDQLAHNLVDLLACDRQGQSGHMLLNLSQDCDIFVREVVEVFGNQSGQLCLFEVLFGDRAPADLSFIGSDDLRNIGSQAPEMAELSKWDNGAILLHGGNLQHLTWLGIQWTLLGQKADLREWLKQLFPRLTLETSKLDTNAPESICLLDIEVFLCGVIFTSHTQLQEAQLITSGNQLHEPRCLPLPITKLLSTEKQRSWWDAVYSLIHKKAAPGMSAKLRMTVQHGLNTLRAGEKHGLQPALLIRWAHHLSETGNALNSYYDQKEYIGRCVHYWKVVLPFLEKIMKSRSIPEPLDPIFVHFHSKDIQPNTVRCYEEEATTAFATLLDIEGKTEEAIAMLEAIDNISSSWHLARIYQRLSEEAGNGLEETQDRCIMFLRKCRKNLKKIYHANVEKLEKLPVSMDEVLDLLNDITVQLGESNEAAGEEEACALHSSPYQTNQLHEPGASISHIKFSTPSPTKNTTSPSKRHIFSPKTPPPWAEDQKSLLQTLCQQIEDLKKEVHDLKHNSSGTTASPHHRLYGDSYASEALQESFPAAQNFHGAPLTVSTTGPSVYYNQSPGYNSQYLLRTAANVTPPKAPVYGINRLPPQQHMYAYQQPTHTPPMQSTPGCMYPQDQVYGPPLRFESPATTLLSPYSEEYYSHQVPQPTANPPLPEPGYFTKPSVVPPQPPKTVDPKLGELGKINFGQQMPNEVHNFGTGAMAQSATGNASFKFNSNFKSNDGDFTFSSVQVKGNGETLLDLLTSDIPTKPEGQKTLGQDQTSSQGGGFNFTAKNASGFSFTEGAQHMSKPLAFGKTDTPFSFTDVDKKVFGGVSGARQEERDGESENESSHIEDEDGPHFEPIVPLPDKVDVKTGEEEEEDLFCNRAKLFRFDSETKEWKERGIGSIKILKHKTSGKVRVLMRREQVLKICANHYITTDMVLKPNSGSDKSWVWYAVDYADEMPKMEQLAIRFKTAEEAALFKAKFEKAQEGLSKLTQEPKKAEKASLLPIKRELGFGAQFAKKEGEWDCNVCCIRNVSTVMQCAACQSPNPSAKSQPDKDTSSKEASFKFVKETSKPTSSVSASLFKFGTSTTSNTVGSFGAQFARKEGEWDCDSCLVRNKANVANCVSCQNPNKHHKGDLSAMFGKKDGQWDCTTCLVRNEGTASVCVSCQSAKPGEQSTTAAAPSASAFNFNFSSKNVPSQPANTGLEARFDTSSKFMAFSEKAEKISPANFSFAQIDDKSSKGAFSCGQGDAKNSPASFTFGNSGDKTSTGSFTFGQSSEKTSKTPFSFDDKNCPTNFTFGIASETDVKHSSGSFSFSKMAATGGFKFGTSEPVKLTSPEETQTAEGSASQFLKSIAQQHQEREKTQTSSSCTHEPDTVIAFDKAEKDENPTFSAKPNMFSFADLAKSSSTESPFAQKDPNFKGFSGAGEKLFSSRPDQKLDTSAEHDEEGMYKTEENDDIQFEPVVQMPEKVDLITGEEEEEVLYSQRVKLFRFDAATSQWKERGVGNLKVLKNTVNGRLRVLMRREQVLRVCANHWITTTMNLKPLSGSDKAWMWLANDFADGDARLEQLAAKFKTTELAQDFKQKFEECQRLLLDIPLQTPHKLVDSGRTAHLIKKAEEMKSGLKDLKSFLTDEKAKLKGDPSEISSNVDDNSDFVKPHTETIGSTLEWDNYDFREDSLDDSRETSVYASPLASSPVQRNLFRFGESTSGFSFSFQPILSPKSPAKPNQSRVSVGTDEESETTQEEERDGQYFEPVVPLPALVDTSTGEEDEQVLFSHRAKLYRYDKNLSQWKERGIGDLKILQNYSTKRVRLIMRRDQVLKLCANHWITSEIKLEPMSGSERAWIWSAMDFAEPEGKVEQLAVRFKLQDVANTFKEVFEKAKVAQEEDVLLSPISQHTTPHSTSCGQDAITVLEETTKERTDVSPQKISIVECTSPASKNVVSPPKFVFGSDSLQKIFGSSPTATEKAPAKKDPKDETSFILPASSKAGADQKSQTLVDTTSPFKIPEKGLDFRLFKDNPMAFWTSTSTNQFQPEVTTHVLAQKMKSEDQVGLDGYSDSEDVQIVYVRQPTEEQKRLALSLMLPLTFFCYQNEPGYTSDDSNDDEDFQTAVRKLAGQLYPDSDGESVPCNTQVSDSAPSRTQLTEPTPSSTKITCSTASSTQRTDSTPPNTQGTDSTLSTTQLTDSAPPNEQGTVSTSSSTQVTDSTPLNTQVTDSTPFSTQVTDSTPFSTQVTDSTPTSTQERDSECIIIWEKKPTFQEAEKAKNLQLPSTFFCGAGSDSETEKDKQEDFETEVRKVQEEIRKKLEESSAEATVSSSSDNIQPQLKTVQAAELQPQPDSSSDVPHGSRPIDLSTKKSGEPDSTSMEQPSNFGFSSSGFSFADLAKTSGDFAFGKKDSNFSWANAGAAVFSSSPSKNEAADENGDDEASSNVEIHFEPIVSLPEVETRSGEEDEEILFKERTKLYRWDRDVNQWKERGVGDLKILYHPQKRCYRLLMRRDQVFKVCANHTISKNMELKPMNTSANALVWTATDYTDGEGRVEQLAAKFKTAEVASAFKKKFEECQNFMSQSETTQQSRLWELSREDNPVVFLDIAADSQLLGRITIQLFSHIVPKTAENFRALCTGERGFGYRNCVFHRVIPEFMCQTGDITKQDGTGGKSIYGDKFEDENFDVRHTGPGVVSMANRGRDTNNSQFFITLKTAEHLDFVHVAFGFVKHGMDVVKQIGEMGTTSGKSSKKIVIADCGQLS